MPISSILGTLLHNIELKPGKGGQLARAAGTYVQLIGRDQGYSILRLPLVKSDWFCHHVWHQLVQYQTKIIKTPMMVRQADRGG